MKYKCLLIVLILFLAGCNQIGLEKAVIYKELDNKMPSEIPKDFEIIFKYGIHEARRHNSINTINDTITKDLVIDGLAIGPLSLEVDELESIYLELRKVNIIEYPNVFKPPYKDNPDPNIAAHCTPSSEYILEIYYRDAKYELFWHDENCSESLNAVNLKECFREIIRIIYETDDYMSLPERNGAYE